MSERELDALAERWAKLDPDNPASGVRLVKELEARAERKGANRAWLAMLGNMLFGLSVFAGFFYMLYRFFSP